MGSSRNYSPSPPINYGAQAPMPHWYGRGGFKGMINTLNKMEQQRKENDINGMNAYNAKNPIGGTMGYNGISQTTSINGAYQPQLNVGTYENTIEQPKTTFNPYFGNYLNY